MGDGRRALTPYRCGPPRGERVVCSFRFDPAPAYMKTLLTACLGTCCCSAGPLATPPSYFQISISLARLLRSCCFFLFSLSRFHAPLLGNTNLDFSLRSLSIQDLDLLEIFRRASAHFKWKSSKHDENLSVSRTRP